MVGILLGSGKSGCCGVFRPKCSAAQKPVLVLGRGGVSASILLGAPPA